MPQLRIVVTGDTNSGKSTLTNAVIGRELLPTSSQSETSVITYVVPLQVGEDCNSIPVLHCYSDSKLQPVAEGHEGVQEYLQDLNLRARSTLGAVQCVECRLDCPLRDSLNVFVPPAAEWQDVQFLDIGGANEILNPAVQVCADLAYALSHRLIVCVRHDQITSRATQQLVLDIRAKAPYHFNDDLARPDRCPLIFAITQADQVLDEEPGEKWEVLRQSLRAVLHRTLADCVELTQVIPIVIVSAKNALDSQGKPQYEWHTFEDLLINTAGLKRDVIQESKVRRAAYIHELLKENLATYENAEAWPYNAQCLWHSRRDFGKKIAIGSAVAAGSVGTALAFGVFLSASSAAAVAAAEAGAASAEATAAAAAANSWWAWAFGFGQFSAAATAASGAAATAEAAAASAAATAGAWGLGSAIAGVSTAGLTISAASNSFGHSNSDGISSVAGMTVVHASAVRVRDVRLAFRAFKSTASADRIKAGKSYRDVLFYPDGTGQWNRSQNLGSLIYPFLLYNRKNSAYLTFDGSQVHACSSRDRPGQLWWAVSDSASEGFILQNADHWCNLRVEEPMWFSPDRRKAVRCTLEVPGPTWTATPGFEEGCIGLRDTKHGQHLFYDGFFVGAFNEVCDDQDWQVLPQVPFYIGGFKETRMSGKGQFFWPNGAPLFKGSLKGGKLVDGFVFDERCICHGHFGFNEEDEPELAGLQPEDAPEGEETCQVCQESPTMATMGKALKPCNHAVTCESCAMKVRECPYCRSPVEGVHRVT
ncbi:unnamed protein product [Durusdinium trenchii]|uniref:Uncharacterized protein n=2 Tax=Durusdinium trenchii TaxID=1381693 RepID=A0ABP0PWK2_9DINO